MTEEVKSDSTLCIICCYSFEYNGCPEESSHKTDKNSFKAFRKQIMDGNWDDLWLEGTCEGVMATPVCTECLTSVELATKRKEKADHIETQVRGLQQQILSLLRDLQKCMGGYREEMMIIEGKVRRSDVNCLKAQVKRGNFHGDKLEMAFQLRDAILKAVKRLDNVQIERLSNAKISGANIMDTSALLSSTEVEDIKIEVEPGDVGVRDDYSEPDDFCPDEAAGRTVEKEEEIEKTDKIVRANNGVRRKNKRRSAVVTKAIMQITQSKKRRRRQESTEEKSVTRLSSNKPKSTKSRQATTVSWRTCSKTNTSSQRVDVWFSCELCPAFAGRNSYILEQHLREHEQFSVSVGGDLKTLSCPHCPCTFANKQLHEFHVASHGATLKTMCDQCPKQFPLFDLKAHIQDVHGTTKVFQCPNCSYCCSTRDRYLEHLRFHIGKKSINACDLCPERFPTKKILLEHLYEVHKAIEMIPCGVSGCSLTFLDERYRKQHQYVHSEQFKCPLCQRQCSSSLTLKAHLQAHNNQRPFKCRLCPATFVQKIPRDAHEATHDSNRPQFNCNICGKSYLHNRSLQAHLSLHQGQGYTCDQCGEVMVSKNSFKRHLQSHSATEEKYFCEQCGKGFKFEDRLRVHLKCHREKTLQCPHCDKSFAQKRYLLRHINLHTNEKTYTCAVCEANFYRTNSLHDHIKRKHPDWKSSSISLKPSQV